MQVGKAAHKSYHEELIRTSTYIPSWFLRLPGCQKVVEPVLLSSMAGHYRHLPDGSQGEGGC